MTIRHFFLTVVGFTEIIIGGTTLNFDTGFNQIKVGDVIIGDGINNFTQIKVGDVIIECDR